MRKVFFNQNIKKYKNAWKIFIRNTYGTDRFYSHIQNQELIDVPEDAADPLEDSELVEEDEEASEAEEEEGDGEVEVVL